MEDQVYAQDLQNEMKNNCYLSFLSAVKLSYKFLYMYMKINLMKCGNHECMHCISGNSGNNFNVRR